MSEAKLTIEAIHQAQSRLQGQAQRTPLLRFDPLDQACGAAIFVKPENLQKTGSFKFRGAYNAIAQSAAQHVVAFSSGNHAQGVACAAQMLGKSATIVMPADAPEIKINNCLAFGAKLELVDRQRDDREAIAVKIASETNAELIKPYDDLRVMAGQGTAGLEIAGDFQAQGMTPDAALICTGGGGLVSGCAVALKAAFPNIDIFTVEPAGYDDWCLSLKAGKPVPHESTSQSICDALLSKQPGTVTFATAAPLLKGALAITDDEAAQAVRFAAINLKLVLEPGGAAALAAALTRKIDLTGKTVAVMLSGGNIDPAILASMINGS